MLIPLGFLAGSGGGAEPAYELIATATGTSSSGTIIFDSISQEYKHLQIRYVAKATATRSDLQITYNGVTTGYACHEIYGDSSSVRSGNLVNRANIELNRGVAVSNTADAMVGGIIDILDYSSTIKNTTLKSLHGVTGYNNEVHLTSGLFINTNAISSISLVVPLANFTTTTRFSLYGIKG